MFETEISKIPNLESKCPKHYRIGETEGFTVQEDAKLIWKQRNEDVNDEGIGTLGLVGDKESAKPIPSLFY
ncbi:hypothetical protein VNO78_33608 [Psophocarpus tetragonolobus]|uniref:Uncharacterized protein n=1 Tax=Psophocarpus tetragonolobus TaxID=3891 RepID=A0AAN9P2Q1_PSOTE